MKFLHYTATSYFNCKKSRKGLATAIFKNAEVFELTILKVIKVSLFWKIPETWNTKENCEIAYKIKLD